MPPGGGGASSADPEEDPVYEANELLHEALSHSDGVIQFQGLACLAALDQLEAALDRAAIEAERAAGGVLAAVGQA